MVLFLSCILLLILTSFCLLVIRIQEIKNKREDEKQKNKEIMGIDAEILAEYPP